MVLLKKGVLKMSKELICNECGKNLGGVSVFEFEGNIYCEECFERLTITCDCCGDRIWRDNAEGDSVYALCEDCYNSRFHNCTQCERLIHEDDCYYEDDSDYPYCRECFQRIMSNPIKSYGYKPNPIFYGSDSNIFYGIELEIDKGGEDDENAQTLLDYVNQGKDYIYAKHDGSLSNGFELVSHPMTLEHHLTEVDWEGMFKRAIEMGYRSHQTETCGYHIHVGRSAFGKTYEEQEQAIGRIVFFVERHWTELVKISRRNVDNLNHWCARFATISSTTEETYQKAKNKRVGRYVAVNLENYNTIELRLFRGTLRYQTFIATLQLTDEICYWAINLSDREMEDMSWSDFVSKIPPEKVELIEYLKSKRLYVNEIVTGSEDM